jgi:hypothetical protein
VVVGSDVAGQAPPVDPQAACAKLLEGQRITDEGRQAIRQLMRSERAPEVMDRLMHLAREVGNGEVEAGLTRIIEVMTNKPK